MVPQQIRGKDLNLGLSYSKAYHASFAEGKRGRKQERHKIVETVWDVCGPCNNAMKGAREDTQSISRRVTV